jgi:hypothetical protein
LADRAAALVALHDGDPARATELALAAVAGFADLPLDEAQSRLVASRAFAGAGRIEQAAEEAQCAADGSA